MLRSLPAWIVLLCACAAPPLDPPTARGRVTPIADLPPAYAQVLAAYARGGDEWERARPDVLADPALARFIVDNLIVELVRAHAGLAGPETERSRRAFNRAENELVRLGEHSAPVLVELLAISDGVLATLATDVLVRIGRPALPQVLPLLEDSRPEARRRAAAVLSRSAHCGGEEEALRRALAEHARSDAEWIVRAECALALGARGARDATSEPWRRALEICLADPDVAVAEAAARGLVILGDPRAVPALIGALDRAVATGDVRALRAVQHTLTVLTGEREKSDVRAWSDWWLDHRAEIESGRTFERDARARGNG